MTPFLSHIPGYWNKLRPYHGIILFFVVMMLANWIWKIFVHDGNYDPNVQLFGLNVSWPFIKVQHEVIRVVGLVFELFGIPFGLLHGTTFVFANGQSSEIAWGCTALKQAFIFICIIAFSRGSWKNKWWFILVSLPIIHAINVLRIILVGVVLDSHPHYFELAHTFFFKYFFYFLIFLLWVLWEECFYLRPLKKKQLLEASPSTEK
jgi:exosortase/archaeosortase family protein